MLSEPREQGGLSLRGVLAVARLAGSAQGQGILHRWGWWQGGGVAPGVLPPVVHGARVDAKARQQLEVGRLQANRLTGQLGRVRRTHPPTLEDKYLASLPRQVEIPLTTPGHYITGLYALSLAAPEGTSGDWHDVFHWQDGTEQPR